MSGVEHYAEAERLLAIDPACQCPRTDCKHGRALVAEAQAHAVLALAAATALHRFSPEGLPDRDRNAWYEVAATKAAPAVKSVEDAAA